jgi:two-component system nitrate/nitrite response regulator NarL
VSDKGQLHRNGTLGVFVLVSVRLYCEGLTDALRRAGMEVTGHAASWADAIVAMVARPPDVAVLDVAGPGGLEIVGELRRRVPQTQIVVHAVDEVDRDVLAWAEAGIAGYVTRDGSVDDLIRAVRCAARHEIHCAPEIAAALLERVHVLAARGAHDTPIGSLTTREHEIAELLEAGLSNKQIAAELQIELATVKNHVHSILAKLQVTRRIDAAAHMRRARRALA